MKFFFIYILLFLSYISLSAYVPKDFAIDLQIEKKGRNSLFLSWHCSHKTKNFTLKRLEQAGDSLIWKTLLYNSKDTTYLDTALSLNRTYEYRVENEYDYMDIAYGYNVSSIEPIDQNKTRRLLLAVDEYTFQQIREDILRYMQNLICDNYQVYLRLVPRAEAFSPAKVIETKHIIQRACDSLAIEYIVLFGRVPVPYSGVVGIDGHQDHNGAYPTDTYYVLPERLFTDHKANVRGRPDERTNNVPGDGKFDLTHIRDSIHIAIGRIDFYNLKMYKDSEFELYRKYIDKVERYKLCRDEVTYRAIINESFGMLNGEVPGSEGYVNCFALFGEKGIDTNHFQPNIFEKKYFFSFSAAGSSYRHNGKFISSQDYAERGANCYISCLFGSYFGDWDYPDGLMRMAIASSPTMLNAYYGGRPQWRLHRMNLGETIGEMYKFNINHDTMFRSTQKFGFRMVHINLMGDPTIRLYPYPPPQNVILARNEDRIKLTWTADTSLYSVYRVQGNTFTRLTDEPISEGEFNFRDTCSKCYYLVKALPRTKHIKTNSAAFYRESIGTIAQPKLLESTEERLIIYYDPHLKQIELNSREKIGKVELYSMLGELVYSVDNANESYHRIDTRALSQSVHFLRVNNGKAIMIYNY